MNKARHHRRGMIAEATSHGATPAVGEGVTSSLLRRHQKEMLQTFANTIKGFSLISHIGKTFQESARLFGSQQSLGCFHRARAEIPRVPMGIMNQKCPKHWWRMVDTSPGVQEITHDLFNLVVI